MNRKPPKPCAHHGCPALTHDRFCPAHQRAEYKAQDERRGTTTERGYGAAWRKIVEIQKQREPLCRMHLARGEVVPMREVDHILPKVRGGTDDWENLQSLCKPCHSAKTAREVLHGN